MLGTVTVLDDKTYRELGVHISGIDQQSTTKIYVECDRCSEQFQREYRNRTMPHHCPTHIVRDGTPLKACASCDIYWSYADFVYDHTSPDLFNRRCNTCRKCHSQIDKRLAEQQLSILGVAAPVRLECRRLVDHAKLPARSRTTDAGLDVYSIESGVIPPHGVVRFRTGVIVTAPPGFYLTIDGRSSLWTKGIIPCRGILDATYVGELWIDLMNVFHTEYAVQSGDKIAQIVLHRLLHADLVEVIEFSQEYNQRGTAGFGSSGR